MKDIFLILMSVSLNAAAQVLIRAGMLKVGNTTSGAMLIKALPTMLTNWQLWLAMVAYGVSILTWMMALSKFEVSFAYAFLALGFVLVTLCGYFFFDETINILRIAGVGLICIGVLLVARS
jgi:multidrug transporter EmrE-like cation transporter